jgi:hypothetical protein
MMDAIIARLREPQLVGEMHELIFPVFAQSSDEMESLFKEELHEGSGNGAVISKKLAAQFFDHRGNRRAIIDIACGKPSRQQFALVIDR